MNPSDLFVVSRFELIEPPGIDSGRIQAVLSSLRVVTGPEELGRGGRLRDGAAGELVAAAYAAESAHGPRLARGLSLADLAHAVALVEGGDLARGRREGARAGAARAARGSRRRVSLGSIARRRLQRPRGRARTARRAIGRRLAERGAPSARGVSRRAPADRPRRRSRAARRARRPGRGARAARARDGDRARDGLHLSAARAADDRRPSVARVRLPGAARRRSCAHVTRRARHERRRARAAARARAGRSTARDSPSCSAATGSSSTPRTLRGRPTSTSSCSRRSRSPRRTRASSARTSRSTPARSSASIELADAHSRASALMPQKKNPYALAAIRTQAGQAAGDLAAALVAVHTGSARTDHFHLLNGTVPRALDEAVAIARLTASVLEGIELRLGALRADRARELRHRRRRRRRPRADGRDRLSQRAQGRRPRRPRARRRRRAAFAADAGAARRRGRGCDRQTGRSSTRRRFVMRSTLPRAPPPGGRRARRPRPRWPRCWTGSTRRSPAHATWSETAREREAAAETALLARARELAAR